MTVEHKRRCVTPPVNSGYEICARVLFDQETGFDAEIAEKITDVLNAGHLIPRGVGGVETYELL
jgi:hypothetical protein